MTFSIKSLNYNNAKAVLSDGLNAINSGKSTCQLDGLEQVDSATLAVLVTWQSAAQKQNKTLSFSGAPQTLKSLATLYGVDDLLNFVS